jgi:hypothetical protein
MRGLSRWLPLLMLLLGATHREAAGDALKVDFQRDIVPILAQKCQPCHFPGGKMYSKLPFDRPETITLLGEKLFTRIRDDPSRATIRKFLAQNK